MFDYIDKIADSAPDAGAAGKFSTFGDYIAVVFNYALGIGASMALIGIILAGIKYMGAKSDPKKIEEARDALFWSIVAMLLVLGAYGITLVVLNTLGMEGVPESQGGWTITFPGSDGGGGQDTGGGRITY